MPHPIKHGNNDNALGQMPKGMVFPPPGFPMLPPPMFGQMNQIDPKT